jgi:uncharacterized membrane protein YsdA (DUF1294 family)/cold shock CspA family protein
MRYKGKITNWNDDKGYGFIEPSLGGKQVFVHVKAFNKRNNRPLNNQIVTYELSNDKAGRVCAKEVLRAGEKRVTKTKGNLSNLPLMVFLAFSLILLYSIFTHLLPVFFLIIYITVSLFTLILYAIDKSAAKNRRWRIPENTLHLLSIVGGWPGAMYAQQLFRHKSKKKSFRLVFWVTVVVNISIILWLLSPSGIHF